MARIKIELPNTFQVEVPYKIKVTDLNYGGHMDNSRVLALAHECRLAWLENFGWSEIDLEGLSTILADAGIVYKAEGHLNDELLIQVGVGEVSGSGFELYYQMKNLTKGMDLAHVKTASVFFDYKLGKVQRVPENFIPKIQG